MATRAPPNIKSKGSEPLISQDQCNCLVYDKQIDDIVEDLILCEGKCQGWIHRMCAGLFKKALKLAQDSPLPFLCHYCNTKEEISLLKTELAAAKSAVNNPITQNSSLQQSQTYSSVVQNNPDIFSPNLILPRASPTSGLQEKKFNIIVYGVEESPKGSNRHLRDIQDTRAVTEIFKLVEPQVPDHSLRDCHYVTAKGQGNIPKPNVDQF